VGGGGSGGGVGVGCECISRWKGEVNGYMHTLVSQVPADLILVTAFSP